MTFRGVGMDFFLELPNPFKRVLYDKVLSITFFLAKNHNQVIVNNTTAGMLLCQNYLLL